MAAQERLSVLDPLYGPITFNSDLSQLVRTPLVQRLRHVRLSNIDSVDLPGISGITRFEHSLGVAHLATQTSFSTRLGHSDALVLQAAALLHDSAITPFGHLFEEALAYAGLPFRHEEKWRTLIAPHEADEIGGIERQFYFGRPAGLSGWARAVFGSAEWNGRLMEVFDATRGGGVLGPAIAGSMDLDNIDNVVRVAFHLGLTVNRQLPLQLAKSMASCEGSHGVGFSHDARIHITDWLALRRRVYEQLMPARTDFAGKIMMLYASVLAIEVAVLRKEDWTLTDTEYLSKLTACNDRRVSEASRRWLIGEHWDLSDITWYDGPAPDYATVLQFGLEMSKELKRECFAYRIKDKRLRAFEVRFGRGPESWFETFGQQSTHWICAVGSPLVRQFTREENRTIVAMVESHFGVRKVEKTPEPAPVAERNMSLFGD